MFRLAGGAAFRRRIGSRSTGIRAVVVTVVTHLKLSFACQSVFLCLFDFLELELLCSKGL